MDFNEVLSESISLSNNQSEISTLSEIGENVDEEIRNQLL